MNIATLKAVQLGLLIGIVHPALALDASPAKAEKLFALSVKSLISEKCFGCHGEDPDKIKGGLNLMSRDSMLQGGETSRQVLVPGDAEASLLYKAVTWADPELEMPPKENDRLSREQVWQVRDWINGGAPWPDEARVLAIRKRFSTGVTIETSGGLSEDWNQRRYQNEDLWAYQPLRHPEVPRLDAGGQDDPEHPIDAFIDRGLKANRISPAPPADRGTLIRRVSFDLTGLPPTPEEVEDFARDPAPDERAWSSLIDRLLASPHYGEHWARHWLDAARYADSSGYANDYDRGNAWRYRDYVVRSFNEDKPYNRFILEQIAGDELNSEDSEKLVAAGFLRMGPWELTGMEVAKVARQRFLDDVTDNVGQVFLSHPLRCAKCHDHKFDPIPTRDYYRMQAVFTTTQLVEREAPFLSEENTDGFDEKIYLEMKQQRFRENLKRLAEKEEKAARQWCEDRGLPYISRGEGLKKGIPEDRLPPRHAGFSVEDYGLERISRKGLERIRWQMDRYQPYAFSVYSGKTPNRKAVYAPVRMPENEGEDAALEPTAILAGGDPFSPLDPVQPGSLSVLHALNPAMADAVPLVFSNDIKNRRLQLARWIANEHNPLTARSIVNRVWQWHFGQGLAGNPNNFGATGKKPTHPELLDWLAGRFIEEGWSFKKLHRLILTSKAYRRSCRHPDPAALTQADPDGTSYAAFQPRRLTAEELRDAMLRVSGELNPVLGGIPVRPEINLEAALQPRMVMGTFAAAWQPSPLPEQRHRRSIYALKIRGQRDPFMEVFNEPSPETSCEARDASSVTPQVFSLFNSESVYDRSMALAARLLANSDDRRRAIENAFQLAFGRFPSERETRSCLDHWSEMEERHRNLHFDPPSYPDKITRHAVEENTGEKFHFVERLDAYQDFVPDLKPADLDAKTRGLAEVCLVIFNSNEFIYVY